MAAIEPKAQFEDGLSDEVNNKDTLTIVQAQNLFTFFKNCTLFRWHDTNNDCEDRANAACILLDEWKIPNYKGWIFSGAFLKRKAGRLVNWWNYHVAPVVPVLEDDEVRYYVIDPSTSSNLESIADWASQITEEAHSYFLIKHSHYYIFPQGKITRHNWFKRNRQNYKWTMQGLSGINGASRIGKAQICFNKLKIKKAEALFKAVKKTGYQHTLTNSLFLNSIV